MAKKPAPPAPLQDSTIFVGDGVGDYIVMYDVPKDRRHQLIYFMDSKVAFAFAEFIKLANAGKLAYLQVKHDTLGLTWNLV